MRIYHTRPNVYQSLLDKVSLGAVPGEPLEICAQRAIQDEIDAHGVVFLLLDLLAEDPDLHERAHPDRPSPIWVSWWDEEGDAIQNQDVNSCLTYTMIQLVIEVAALRRLAEVPISVT